MAKPCKCKACGRKFTSAHKNEHTQAFCAKDGCQRERRAVAQRLRRRKAASRPPTGESPSDRPGDASRLQPASVLSEADFRSEHPVIIGLISMLIGTAESDRVEATYRQLWIRGMQIISTGSATVIPNSPIHSLFDELKGGARRAG